MNNGSSSRRLNNKVALITGAGQGIGREIALRFGREGARVIIADLNGETARAVAAEIGAAGGDALAITMDITQPSMISSAIAETLDRCGRIDVLVNNAGIGSCVSVLEMTLEEWERNLCVNLTGTFLCAQAVARVMVRQGGGRIINIASISGQRGGVGRAAYGAAKAGVIQLTRVMAVELAPHGIGVNAISPGPVDTEQSRYLGWFPTYLVKGRGLTEYAGAVSGAMNTAGSAGAFVCTWLFGRLVGAFGDYEIPMFFIAGMVAIAACLFWLIDPTQAIESDDAAAGTTAAA